MSGAVDGFPVDATLAMRFLLDRGDRDDEIINDDRTPLIFHADRVRSLPAERLLLLDAGAGDMTGPPLR